MKLDTGPQTEDGYTQIANELLDALTRTRVPGEERQMFDFILRKTYGFNKKMDMISLSQFVTTTGVKRQNVHSSLKSLFIKRMIVIQKNDNGSIKYGINKHYQEWLPSSKKITPSSKKMTTVIQKDSELSSKKIPTKDTLTKERKDSLSPSEFSDLWNATVAGKLPTVLSLSEARKRKIKSRLAERPLAEWKMIFDKIVASPFCRGESKGGWKANLDWIIANDNNAVKVLEGTFDPPEAKPEPSTIDTTVYVTPEQSAGIQQLLKRRLDNAA